MVKAYDHKLKRHGHAVMSLYSPMGIEGTDIVSAATDYMIRGKLEAVTLLTIQTDRRFCIYSVET